MSPRINFVALNTNPSYKATNKETNDMVTMTEETVKTLKDKADQDPLASAVFKIWAHRERNRHNMTVRGLYYRMRKEGFKYQEKDLAPIFKFLADLGLGKLDISPRGKIEAIRDFKTPIQSIGALASGSNGSKLTLVKVPHIEVKPKAAAGVAQTHVKAVITLYVNNKPIEIKLPEQMTKEELISILGRFYGL